MREKKIWPITLGALIALTVGIMFGQEPSIPSGLTPLEEEQAREMLVLGAQQGHVTCTGPDQHYDPNNPCSIRVDGVGESWTWTAKTDEGAEFLGCVQTTNDFVAWTCGIKWPVLVGHDYSITKNPGALAETHPEHHEALFGAALSDWADKADCALIGALCTNLVADTNLGHQYLGCLNNTPASTAWACWFKYPAVVDRDYHYES